MQIKTTNEQVHTQYKTHTNFFDSRLEVCSIFLCSTYTHRQELSATKLHGALPINRMRNKNKMATKPVADTVKREDEANLWLIVVFLTIFEL